SWTTTLLGLGMLALCYLWAKVEGRVGQLSLLRLGMPCAVTLAVCWLTYASFGPFCEVPTWQIGEQIRQPTPLDPSRRYLSLHVEEDMFAYQTNGLTQRCQGRGAELYVANVAMYSGADFINGYSPMMPYGLEAVFSWKFHGFFRPGGAERILAVESGPDGLLAFVGVDGLVVADRFASFAPTLRANGWEEVAEGKGGSAWHRTGPPSPRLRALAGGGEG